MAAAAGPLVPTLLLVAVFFASTGCSGRFSEGRARRPLPAQDAADRSVTAAFVPTRTAARTKAKAKGAQRKDADGGSLRPPVRLRVALLHALYMVTASEALTRLSLAMAHLCVKCSVGLEKPLYGAIETVCLIIPALVIIAANIVVWKLWNHTPERSRPDAITVIRAILTQDKQKAQQLPFGQKAWMCKHFTCTQDPTSEDRANRPHTVLTSAFSQRELSHLQGNMMNLSIYAPWVLAYLGTYRRFFYFYVGSIHVSRFFADFLLLRVPEKRHWNPRLGVRGWTSRQLNHFMKPLEISLGASGAVVACETFFYLSFCWLRFGVASSLAWSLLYLLKSDLVHLLHNTYFGTALGDSVGYRTHLGGQLFGTLLWLCTCRLTINSLGQKFMSQPLFKWVWRTMHWSIRLSCVLILVSVLRDIICIESGTGLPDWPHLLCLWRQALLEQY